MVHSNETANETANETGRNAQMAKYRVAIIACGQIARSHAYGWQAIPEAEIWTIADTNEDARREFGEHFGVPEERRYTDLREMLDRERPDFVSVCSWHPLHAEFTIAAAARKPKAIICDKPMATCLGEADEMITACSRERVKLAIGHQRRFLANWAEAARLVRAGAIGDPVRGSVNTGVGLLNNATHSIDMLRYLLGDPETEWVMGNVQRRSDRYERSIPCEECAIGTVGFAGGAIGTILSGVPFPRGPQQAESRPPWVQVFGTRGMIEVGIGRPDPARRPLRDDGAMRVSERFPSAHYNDEEGTARLFNDETKGWQTIDVPFRDPFAGEMRELVDWAEGKIDDHRGSARNARATIEIMMAIYESARLTELVRIPLETRANPLQLMIDDGILPVSRPGAYETRATLVRGEGMNWNR